jgi:hypothetical protein
MGTTSVAAIKKIPRISASHESSPTSDEHKSRSFTSMCDEQRPAVGEEVDRWPTRMCGEHGEDGDWRDEWSEERDRRPAKMCGERGEEGD